MGEVPPAPGGTVCCGREHTERARWQRVERKTQAARPAVVVAGGPGLDREVIIDDVPGAPEPQREPVARGSQLQLDVLGVGVRTWACDEHLHDLVLPQAPAPAWGTFDRVRTVPLSSDVHSQMPALTSQLDLWAVGDRSAIPRGVDGEGVHRASGTVAG